MIQRDACFNSEHDRSFRKRRALSLGLKQQIYAQMLCTCRECSVNLIEIQINSPLCLRVVAIIKGERKNGGKERGSEEGREEARKDVLI